MTSITPALLAYAYARITVPNAPRATSLTVVGLAAADTPPQTTADMAFSNEAGASPSAILSGAISTGTVQAASGVGLKSPVSVYATGGGTAAYMLGQLLDTSA